MDSPESWRTYQSRGVLLVFIFGFSMLSYGSIPVIESTMLRFSCFDFLLSDELLVI